MIKQIRPLRLSMASVSTVLLVAFVMVLPVVAEDLPIPPDVGGVPDDAALLDSGVATRVLTTGDGDDRAAMGDWVIIHYSGWTTDGKVFDSSVAKGKAVRAPFDYLVAGMQEGLALMAPGEKRRMWIPGELAYKGQDGKPQGMLVFDLELQQILHRPETPLNVSAPPADAVVGKGGLATKVLRAGTGDRNPKRNEWVSVHYAGWTTDGAMFDTSVLSGKPTSFRLDQVIRGWTMSLQMMVEGEKRRLWIPDKLAYKGIPDKPQGMLVFDVELLEIKPKN